MSDNNGRRMVVPHLFFPNIEWQESDYAHLQARLDLFSDFVLLSKVRDGQITEKFLVDPLEVTAALSGLEINSGLLPRACLFWGRKEGQDCLGLYLEPQLWPVTIHGERESWQVPLPGLVFVGHGFNYSLWAVNQRPTRLDTALYRAPTPNVHQHVCQGNAPFPQAGPETIWQAVDIFFTSRFNRDLSDGKSRHYPGCVLDHWRALWQAGVEEYPLNDLIPAQQTLKEVIYAA
jgi:hypothetical protein